MFFTPAASRGLQQYLDLSRQSESCSNEEFVEEPSTVLATCFQMSGLYDLIPGVELEPIRIESGGSNSRIR